MADPRIVEGAPAPLFERLVDLAPKEPTETEVFRFLSPEDLRASVRRELARLVETRRPVSIEAALSEGDLTVLDYGVPDYSVIHPLSRDERLRFAEALRRAIVAFEPRLREPRVEVGVDPKRPTALAVRVEGYIRCGSIMEEVWFPIDLGIKTAAPTGG